MKTYLFPRDRTFWLYHGSALLVTIVIQGLIIWGWRDQQLFNIVGSLLWLPLYTLGVLAFRYQYRKYHWHRMNMARLIILVLIYGLGVGFFVTIMMLLGTLPFFWDTLFTPEFLEQHNLSIGQHISILVISNVLSTQLFASAWMFIYISVTTNRRVREAELDNLKLENSLKEARLTSLTSQLNPHFLFNSLNNIRFMIHENPVHADETITALSEILRYSLESGRKEKVPLEEELAVVQRYLEVMALQLEQRLRVELSVPDALAACLIPPMSLQLLVENAIKHGIEPLKQTGTLTITAAGDHSSLWLTVSNPSPGTSCDPRRNTGAGLTNIEQRLRLLYGDAAQLAVVNDTQTYSVTLTLPKESQP